MTVLQGMSIVAGYSREGGNSPSCKSTLPVRRRRFIRLLIQWVVWNPSRRVKQPKRGTLFLYTSSWIGASFNTRITLSSISPAKSQAGERLPFKSKHKAGSSSKDGTVNLISLNICRDKACGHTLKPCRPTSKQICYQKCVSTQSLFLKL